MGHDYCHREGSMCAHSCPDCSNTSEAEYANERERDRLAREAMRLDNSAVDLFARAMKAKLAQKRLQGRGGWNDKQTCTAEELSKMLREHINKGDPTDVANFCMMLYNRGEGIL